MRLKATNSLPRVALVAKERDGKENSKTKKWTQVSAFSHITLQEVWARKDNLTEVMWPIKARLRGARGAGESQKTNPSATWTRWRRAPVRWWRTTWSPSATPPPMSARKRRKKPSRALFRSRPRRARRGQGALGDASRRNDRRPRGSHARLRELWSSAAVKYP